METSDETPVETSDDILDVPDTNDNEIDSTGIDELYEDSETENESPVEVIVKTEVDVIPVETSEEDTTEEKGENENEEEQTKDN